MCAYIWIVVLKVKWKNIPYRIWQSQYLYFQEFALLLRIEYLHEFRLPQSYVIMFVFEYVQIYNFLEMDFYRCRKENLHCDEEFSTVLMLVKFAPEPGDFMNRWCFLWVMTWAFLLCSPNTWGLALQAGSVNVNSHKSLFMINTWTITREFLWNCFSTGSLIGVIDLDFLYTILYLEAIKYC